MNAFVYNVQIKRGKWLTPQNRVSDHTNSRVSGHADPHPIPNFRHLSTALFQALCFSVTFSEFVKSKSFKEKHLGKKGFSSLFKNSLIF